MLNTPTSSSPDPVESAGGPGASEKQPEASGPPSRAAEIRRWASIAGSMLLGAVFLVAAWAKSLDPVAFAGQIENEGLDFLLPAGAVALFALWLEWTLGAALLLAVRRKWVLWPTAALVLFFVFLTGRTYWRYLNGIEPEAGCGCFGNLVERTPAEAFWQDLLLMVPPLLLAFLAMSDGRRLPKLRLAATLVIGLAMTLFAWRAPQLPLDDLATRLRPGIDPLTLCAGQGASRICLDAILPELMLGEHLVILADVSQPELISAIPALNEFHWQPDAPSLWALTSATEEELFELRFLHGPSFELRETPPALMRPLYRTLPRSFAVRDGEVVATFAGLPPLDGTALETVEGGRP